jgi:short-subunit dehydrogenase
MKAEAAPVVWITGASSGIGASLVKECLKDGYKVILSSRRQDQLEAIMSQQDESYKDRMAVLTLDLADGKALEDKCREATAIFGHVDLLINNGGISQRSLAADTEMSVYRRLMEVNYFGNIALSKGLLPHFLARGRGQIAVVSSLVGKFGSPYRSGYAASKHALHGFYDSLRAELTSTGIDITIICPGFIRTDVSVNALTEDGSRLQKMDEAQARGMDPDICAKKIMRDVKKKKREVYIGGKEVMGIYIKRFFPGIFSTLLPKAKVR